MALISVEASFEGAGVIPVPYPAVRLSDCRHGRMLYFPNDTYVGVSLDKYGEYVEEEIEFLLRGIPEGACIVEVGANIGACTVPLAKRVGQRGCVIAFEPQRILHTILCGNVAINNRWNVFAECIAIGDKNGTVFVPSVDYTQNGNFGGVELSETPTPNPVPIHRLDDLDIPGCYMLKIDVEGMELDVLKGAEQVIAKFRPLIYCENDREEKKHALIEHLSGLDYDLYWHIAPLYNSNNFRGDAENVFPQVASINMACIPHECADRIKTNLTRIER